MTPPTKDLGPDIDTAFEELHAKLEQARDKDWQEMNDHHGFWNQVGSAIKNAFSGPTFFIPVVNPVGGIVMGAFKANQAKNAAEEAMRAYEKLMWQAYEKAHATWENPLKTATGAALQLADVARTWEDQRKTAFSQVTDQIRKLEQQEHWTGKSAQGYTKAIPSQRGAVTQFGTMVGGSSKLYEQSGLALTTTYTTVLQTNTKVRSQVSDMLPVQDTENWGRRMRGATALIAGAAADGKAPGCMVARLNQAIDQMKKLGEQALKDQQGLEQRAHESAPFKKGHGAWPQAKGDTTDMVNGAESGRQA